MQRSLEKVCRRVESEISAAGSGAQGAGRCADRRRHHVFNWLNYSDWLDTYY
jgi:hypothetical protein